MDQSNHRHQAGGETRTSDHHVIGVFREEERRDWLTSMEAKIDQPPKLLNESAGKESCSIFRLPQSLMEINQKAYQPHIVSIGPYYNGKQHLQMIQEHKWRYLGAIVTRTKPHGIGLDQLVQAIASKLEAIRECYSETIQIHSHLPIEMMVLDGCFILELFRKVYQIEATDQDPILKIAWILPFITRDLLMLENQLPLFVLQTLCDEPILALGENIVPSLNILVLEFFSSVVGRPLEILERHEQVHGKHILDILRLSLIPIPTSSHRSKNNDGVHLIPSAEKLHLAGIRFEPREIDSFVDIKFSNGVLQIPTLMLDDFSSSLLLNCVAFEQCHRHCSTDITTYATFMGCLISTPGDVGFFGDRKIIENYVGTDDQVALFFNTIGKDMPTDISESYLTELFNDVNKYISKGWHVHWAEFKNTYFGTRWSFISAIAASVLLIFALIQAFFAVYPYAD